MQEIKKRRIVIASVLKPVDDIRMTEKIGLSLASLADVHIIGMQSSIPDVQAPITFHPFPRFSRLSLARFIAPLTILKKILTLKPTLFIITTHELVWTAVFCKLFMRIPVVYDVQENYWRNIRYTQSFPFLLRDVVASYVRINEWATSPFIDHFLLAEKGYTEELSFVGTAHTIIENKLRKPKSIPPRSTNEETIRLLFTGTLAESTGVFSAIALATKLAALDNRIELQIVGFCQQPETINRLKNEIVTKPFITGLGIDQWVPHQKIVEAIQQADYGIIAYPPNPSTQNTIPTKLYEYLGFKLPILLIDHPVWVTVCKPFSAAITFQEDIPAADILQQMTTSIFYPTDPQDIYWESEQIKLIACIKSLL